MKFTLISVVAVLAGFAAAQDADASTGQIARRQSNAGRPVPSGSCCVANTSLKQDFCQVNGQQGKCVPSGSANCTSCPLRPLSPRLKLCLADHGPLR